jgi:hypothetical protein
MDILGLFLQNLPYFERKLLKVTIFRNTPFTEVNNEKQNFEKKNLQPTYNNHHLMLKQNDDQIHHLICQNYFISIFYSFWKKIPNWISLWLD